MKKRFCLAGTTIKPEYVQTSETMKELIILLFGLFLELIKYVCVSLLAMLPVYIVSDFLCFILGLKDEFPFVRGILIIGGLLLILISIYILQKWLGSFIKQKIELREWR